MAKAKATLFFTKARVRESESEYNQSPEVSFRGHKGKTSATELHKQKANCQFELDLLEKRKRMARRKLEVRESESERLPKVS